MESSYYYENEYYEVEKIITRKKIKGKIYYLIKWLCYSIADCTWEPYENLKDINDMIIKFEEGYPETADLKMYKIYKNAIVVNSKKEKITKKFLNKKRQHEKISNEYLEDSIIEDSNDYLDLLKNHLYITNNSKKQKENDYHVNSKYVNIKYNGLKSKIGVNGNKNKFKKIKLREINI